MAQKKFDAAISACQEWLAAASDDEQKKPEWLGVRFELAEALRRKGEAQAGNSAEGRRLLGEARNAYREVASKPGVHQPAARVSFVALLGGEGQERSKPKTFTEAFERGKEALSSANGLKQAIPTAEKNNPAAVAELKSQAETGLEDARLYLQTALRAGG